MAKDAYWFSHDFNARHDPKICMLRSVYGSEGYGWFWIIIEMLREQKDYKLSVNGKYGYTALAMQMQCSNNAAKEFIDACINDFVDSNGKGLFETDGESIWSESLNKRIEDMEEKKRQRIEKAKKAAQARWEKTDNL